MANERPLTVREVATRLRVREDEVAEWLRSGRLRGTQDGAEWRITEADLEGFIQRLRSQQPDE